MDDKQPNAPGEGAGHSAPSLIHRTDLALGALIIGVSGFLYYATSTFGEVAPLLQQGITPAFFPRIILGFIIALSLFLPFEHIIHARQGKNLDEDRERRIKPITFITALFLMTLLLIMPYLGTIPTMVLSCALFPILWGERRFVAIALYAIGFPAFVSILFFKFLKVIPIPGVIGYIFR
jgi:putative tricarboxylic transport membrane protein